jgi:ankyrin
MQLDAIALEPNSSYVAEGHRSMGGLSITQYKIEIDTDNVGRVRRYSEGISTDIGMADSWDYQKLQNVRTGRVLDLRLYNAALNGRLGLAKEALAEGADVTLRMKQGATALHWAAAKGRLDVAELLLSHGADINAVDELGWTPAFLGSANGFNEIVKMLVERGAKTTAVICGKELSLSTDSDPDFDLIEACESGDFDAAKSAIDKGADVNCTSRDGWTPLLSASNGHAKIIELLLENGADPNVASDRGYSPLMRAAGNGHEEIVRLLLAAGADKQMVDCDGKRASQLAMEMRQSTCAQLVL